MELSKGQELLAIEKLLIDIFIKSDQVGALYEFDRSIRYIGARCNKNQCPFRSYFPTKTNQLDQQDHYGIKWARANLISKTAEHCRDHNHYDISFIIER